MKIKVLSLTEEAFDKRDYRDVMEILIDDKSVFCVYDGEPEDANLRRDFNDCIVVPDLMKMAYEAGVAGETFEIEYLKVDEI